MWLFSFILCNLYTSYRCNTTEEKGAIEVSLWLCLENILKTKLKSPCFHPVQQQQIVDVLLPRTIKFSKPVATLHPVKISWKLSIQFPFSKEICVPSRNFICPKIAKLLGHVFISIVFNKSNSCSLYGLSPGGCTEYFLIRYFKLSKMVIRKNNMHST